MLVTHNTRATTLPAPRNGRRRRVCVHGLAPSPSPTLTAIPFLAEGGGELAAAEFAVLLFVREGCGACRSYEQEVLRRVERGELPGVTIRKAEVGAATGDGIGEIGHPRPWYAFSHLLPYTLLLHEGVVVDGFAATSAAALLDRIESAFVVAPW